MHPHPWLAPELVQLGRLPMHSVPHSDRLELDGTWRFQLLDRPDEDPTATWGEIRVPGAWTMQGFPDRPHYTNVQMPFEGLPAHLPEHQPTGVYERTFELPDGWRGRRIVLHVGAAESVLIARLNDRDLGISKDSHLAAEFDVTELVQPGAELAPKLQSLPPILHNRVLVSLASCSKGSRGLSVLPRENCICTAISISLSPWSRQCGSRYAIRAGRNLPDKEFRYLRTVIVTAAVYRGFGSRLRLAADLSP